MKNLWTAACLAALVAVGCGPAINLNDRPLFSNGTNTFTFLVYDAFTGKGIEDATITLSLGTYSFTATHTTGNAYVASQMPAGQSLATIESPGHVGAVGQPTGLNCGTLSNPASQCFTLWQVALYPSDAVTDDVKIRAFESDKGAPVTTGTVVATLTSNSGPIPNLTNQLPTTLSVRPTTIVATFDASGTATLPHDQLVLGGSYSVRVIGAKGTTGAFLQDPGSYGFTAGEDFDQINIFMGPPAQQPIAITLNNESWQGETDAASVRSSWVITFPYPVEQCNQPSMPTWSVISGTNVNGDTEFAAPPTTGDQTTVSITNSGTTVTVAPKYDTANGGTLQAADGPIVIRFTSGLYLRVVGTTDCWYYSQIPVRDTGSVVYNYRDLLVASEP